MEWNNYNEIPNQIADFIYKFSNSLAALAFLSGIYTIGSILVIAITSAFAYLQGVQTQDSAIVGVGLIVAGYGLSCLISLTLITTFRIFYRLLKFAKRVWTNNTPRYYSTNYEQYEPILKPYPRQPIESEIRSAKQQWRMWFSISFLLYLIFALIALGISLSNQPLKDIYLDYGIVRDLGGFFASVIWGIAITITPLEAVLDDLLERTPERNREIFVALYTGSLPAAIYVRNHIYALELGFHRHEMGFSEKYDSVAKTATLMIVSILIFRVLLPVFASMVS